MPTPLEQALQERDSLRREWVQLRAHVGLLRNDLTLAQGKLEATRRDHETALRMLEVAVRDRDRAQRELSACEKLRDEAQQRTATLGDARDRAEKVSQSLESEAADLRVELARRTTDFGKLRLAARQLFEDAERLKREAGESSAERDSQRALANSYRAQAQRLEAENDALRRSVGAAGDEIEFLRTAVDRAAGEHKDALRRFDDELNRARTRIEELSTHLRNAERARVQAAEWQARALDAERRCAAYERAGATQAAREQAFTMPEESGPATGDAPNAV